MTDERIAAFNKEVEKVLHYLHGEFAKLQTGRASAALVEHVEVDAYGQKQPLKSVAGITVEDARTIAVQPWDNSILQDVDTALQKAELGTSPQNDGNVIRLILPPMTEERRQTLAKQVHQLAEEARISVRQQRDQLRDKIKEEKDEDVRYTLLEQLDEAAKTANEKIEESMKQKEDDMMTI